jgi:WD40 repeat protein
MNAENENPYEKVERKKAQIVRSDVDIKFLLVAFEAGEIQVNNLFTGALIYNNSNVKPIKIENEVTQMKFFNSQTKFWIAASCWEGRVAFITRPQVTQGRNFLKFKKCKCSHKRDVISLDINSENQLVTASMDNIICFWNSFNGVESKKIILPEEIADLTKGQTIQYVRFPFQDKKDLLMVIINNGDCFILETQTEKFIEFNHTTTYLNKSIDQSQELGSDLDSMNGSNSIIEDGMGATNPSSIHRSSAKNTQSSMDSARGSDHKLEASGKKGKMVQLPTNKYLLGKISTYPTVDIAEGYLVSISENGKGLLMSLKRHGEKKNNWDRGSKVNRQEF